MMGSLPSSSLFRRLVGVWRALQLRSDVDNIILELLGRFALEKIYADDDKTTYQQLVMTLCAQLNAIFYMQRMSLPSETQNVGGRCLGYLASWEVTLRSLEFVLQLVLEGRDSLREVRMLRDKFLAEMLLSSLRFLTLHPKVPRLNRRDRFARIHRLLEQVLDSYPRPEPFLLLICKEITNRLRAEPNALGLPPRFEIPNLTSDLYPLADALSAKNVHAIVSQDSYASDWLSEMLTLRDISQFVVGSFVQYVVNGETRDARLQECSVKTRNAILSVVERLHMPQHFSRLDLLKIFSETFEIILPDTPNIVRRDSSEMQAEECEIEALDTLRARLEDRRSIQRMSDQEMIRNISEITRKISVLSDPSGQFRATSPRLYALNCPKCHFVGDSQLSYSGKVMLQSDRSEAAEAYLPPQSKCVHCGESVTMAREILLARHTWELLKPLELNTDTVNVERHSPTDFQAMPSKPNVRPQFDTGYNMLDMGVRSQSMGVRSQSQDVDGASYYHGHPSLSGLNFRRQFHSMSQAPVSQQSPTFRQTSDPAQDEYFSPGGICPLDSTNHINPQRTAESGRSSNGDIVSPLSPSLVIEAQRVSTYAVKSPLFRLPDFTSPPKAPPAAEQFASFAPVPAMPLSRARERTTLSVSRPEKERSRWISKLTGPKKDSLPSGDSSSLSSTALESQRLEEISLKSLTNTISSTNGRSAKKVFVYLSQNSTNALFWMQTSIHLWDVGTSPPTVKQVVPTESTCVLAAVTKVYLAYIIGTHDQRLTLRIINLLQPMAPVVEYRMPSSPWCTSLTICPKENYVVVGFDGSMIRIFSTMNTEQPREDRLHQKIHDECKSCSPIETLSFSNDGLMLLASTRHPRNGMIQVYSSRFPFFEFNEVQSCRYAVKLHESEDGGVTSAIFRSGRGDGEDLICITTWTQSGLPILVQPESKHKSYVKVETSKSSDKLGNRIQCAAFSPSGSDLMMVNDKGHLYQIRNLNSSPMNIKRIATFKALAGKSESFAMAFMTLPAPDDEVVVMAWADLSKSVAYIKKVTVTSNSVTPSIIQATPCCLELSTEPFQTAQFELPSNMKGPPTPSAELP